MKQIFQDFRGGTLLLADVPAPALRPGGVLVRARYSLISPGTERHALETSRKNLIGKARERPDLVRQVLDKARGEGIVPAYRAVMGRFGAPVPLGYSCSGTVLKCGSGAEGFHPGMRVACAGAGYASHAEVVFVPKNLCMPVPEGVSLREAAFTTLGAIALQGVRRLEPSLGEWIAVIGLGLVGQITASLLKANGCRVIGIDLDPSRVSLALERGIDNALSGAEDLAREAARRTGAGGVDGVVITASSGSNEALELAIELCRLKGRIVVVGSVKMDVPRRPFYEKELDLRISR